MNFKLLFCITFLPHFLLGDVLISNKFNCFSGIPNYVNVGQILESYCPSHCIRRKCLFYKYESGTCYVDDSESDVQEGQIVGRTFKRFDMTYLSYKRNAIGSSVDRYDRTPLHAMDKNIVTVYHSNGDLPAGNDHWWVLDLYNSFQIESLLVQVRPTQLQRFFNIKIYYSNELNFDNFFENADTILFGAHPSSPSTTSLTFSPPGGSPVCARYFIVTKLVPAGTNPDLTPLEIAEFKPVVVNEIEFETVP